MISHSNNRNNNNNGNIPASGSNINLLFHYRHIIIGKSFFFNVVGAVLLLLLLLLSSHLSTDVYLFCPLTIWAGTANNTNYDNNYSGNNNNQRDNNNDDDSRQRSLLFFFFSVFLFSRLGDAPWLNSRNWKNLLVADMDGRLLIFTQWSKGAQPEEGAWGPLQTGSINDAANGLLFSPPDFFFFFLFWG